MFPRRSSLGFLVLGVASCASPPSTSEQSSQLSFAAPLHLVWQKTSHNTFESGHTPDGEPLTWHFEANYPAEPETDKTFNIELDLVDYNQYTGELIGDWTIAHDAFGAPTNTCDGGSSLDQCLLVISAWHNANPEHPLITVWLDKKHAWESMDPNERSPAMLDALITSKFEGSLVLPTDVRGSYASLRDRVQEEGWPTHESLAGKVMFIMTSDAKCHGNERLMEYANNLPAPTVFIAPHGTEYHHVTTNPECFSGASTGWTAIYNFEWVDSDDDGDCDDKPCWWVSTAHDHPFRFLTRVWDVDDAVESDTASARFRGGSDDGVANFIAINKPWLYMDEDPDSLCRLTYPYCDAYGDFPYGEYPE